MGTRCTPFKRCHSGESNPTVGCRRLSISSKSRPDESQCSASDDDTSPTPVLMLKGRRAGAVFFVAAAPHHRHAVRVWRGVAGSHGRRRHSCRSQDASAVCCRFVPARLTHLGCFPPPRWKPEGPPSQLMRSAISREKKIRRKGRVLPVNASSESGCGVFQVELRDSELTDILEK